MRKRHESIAALFDSVPPHDLQAEAALLGSMLHKAAVVPGVAALVNAEDFWVTKHSTIFLAILDAYARNSSRIDIVLVHSLLDERGELKSVGGDEYLVQLAESVPHAEAAESYATIVAEKAGMRRLIDTLTHGTVRAFQCDATADEISSDIQAKLIEAASNSTSPVSTPIGEAAGKVIDDLKRWDDSGDDPGTLRTGLADLDRMTGGFRPGQVIVVAAGTGVGKSAMGLQFCLQFAKDGHAVAVFSLEMTKAQIAERILASVSNVNLAVLTRRRKPTSDELGTAVVARNDLMDCPMHICDSTDLSPASLATKARFMVSRHEIKAIVVDYLQLIKGTRRENRNAEVSEVSRAIKTLALELDVPIVVLSQLNRESGREKRRPRLHDLRDSGAIEQDADVVLFLHDPNRVNDSPGPGYESDIERDLELIVAKQRQGPLGAIKVRFDGSRQLFRNPMASGNVSDWEAA